MIPGDFCRCVGENCERKETCERYVAWRDKIGPQFVSCALHLCVVEFDRYIEVKK